MRWKVEAAEVESRTGKQRADPMDLVSAIALESCAKTPNSPAISTDHPCPASNAKINHFHFSEIHASIPASRFPLRGALRGRHERWGRGAMDVQAALTNAAGADGEIVRSRSPDAGIQPLG